MSRGKSRDSSTDHYRPPIHGRQSTSAGRLISRRAKYAGVISGMHSNIELKARDADPRRSVAVCESLGAEDCGVLV